MLVGLCLLLRHLLLGIRVLDLQPNDQKTMRKITHNNPKNPKTRKYKKKYESIKENYQKVKEINSYVKNNINTDVFKIISGEDASPYILTVSAVGLRGEVLMHMLETKNIIVGNGSACSSKNRYSRVISACGYSNDVLDGIVRISFCTDNTIEEAREFVKIINEEGLKLKGIV